MNYIKTFFILIACFLTLPKLRKLFEKRIPIWLITKPSQPKSLKQSSVKYRSTNNLFYVLSALRTKPDDDRPCKYIWMVLRIGKEENNKYKRPRAFSTFRFLLNKLKIRRIFRADALYTCSQVTTTIKWI